MARPGAGGPAWALVLVVLLSWLLAAGAVLIDVAPSAGPGSTTAPLGRSGEVPEEDRQVVLVGVPGLTWDLVDEEVTPTLARLARGGGAAALVVRGQQEVTCSVDAWLTVGAGQRAGTDAGCRPLTDVVTSAGVDEQVWDGWRQAAADQGLAPELGTLAGLAEGSGTCVAAYGPEAVFGAARPDGSVAVAVPAEPDTFPPGVAGAVGRAAVGDGTTADGTTGDGAPTVCRIHLVSAPPVLEADRSAQLPAIDAALAELVDEVPDGTTVVVAGMGQTGGRAEAQVLVVSPVDLRDGAGGTLSSGTTRQRGLVQLTDLTPTLLSLAGVVPGGVEPAAPAGGAPGSDAAVVGASAALAGEPVTLTPQVGDHVAQVQDLADGISTAKWQAPYVLGALLAVFLVLLAGALVLRGWAGHGIPVLAVVGSAALATPVATFLAGLVPWWRAGQPWPAGVAVVLAGAWLLTALAWAGPWRRHPLGPPAVVAAVTAIVLGVDVIWSARLGLVSVLGLQPVTAGRFYGQGNVGFGVMLGSVLVVIAAVLATVLPRWSAAGAVAALGLGATLLTAAPGGGADFGGVPALVVATGLLTLTALGVRWSPASVVGVALVGGLVGAAAMVLDWLRGPESRTHLGGFVQSVLDGEAGGVVVRKLDQSLGILVGYPVSWLAVLALVGVAVVAVRRPRWSAPLWRLPGMPSVALAALVAMVLAWALNDSGIAAVSLTLAMLIATGVSVLGRSRATA